MILSLGRWQLESDRAATIACYAALPAELDCMCADCRNFTAAHEHAFPAEFQTIASQLGVDLTKPAELAPFGREPSGLHAVGGWFHFVGAIRSGADAWTEKGRGDFEHLVKGFEFGFTSTLWPVADPFRHHAVVQFEFVTRVPWVLAEPEAPSDTA